MNDTDKLNGWEQWGKYVVKELEGLNARYERLEMKLDEINVEYRKETNKRLEKLERFNWVFTRVFVLSSPVLIWAVIEALKKLLSL